ncbi:hypothetical protein HAX54_032485, partial [Datura stramonium]|nr:hypothetical protein [Datura stramonium]
VVVMGCQKGVVVRTCKGRKVYHDCQYDSLWETIDRDKGHDFLGMEVLSWVALRSLVGNQESWVVTMGRFSEMLRLSDNGWSHDL